MNTEPMTDERLEHLRRLTSNVLPVMRDAVVEIDRLRAALAARPEPHLAEPIWQQGAPDFDADDQPAQVVTARPEPIGYSVLFPLPDGSYAFIGTEWGRRSFATPPKRLGRIVVALVPVEAP